MDEMMLRRAQKGDPQAFEQVMTPLEERVWRTCWHYTQNAEDAKDCAQEAMVKAWRALPSFRGECSLETWMYRICVRCCLDFLRAKKRRPTDSMDTLNEAGFDPPDPAPQPDAAVIARDERGRLRQAIALLPEDMRTALILSVLEGRTYEDIARITGAAVGTVKSRINRARVRLSGVMADSGEQFPISGVQQGERRAKS